MKRLVLGLMLLFSVGMHGQNCIDWTYYRNIVIDNTAGPDLVDYQIKVILNTEELVNEGKLQANGADLRVLNSDCEPLSFWGESFDTSTANELWIKLPSIGTGEMETIQIYYGNEDAESVIDGDNTFILFDDFSDSEVDLTKWETVGGYETFEIVNGLLNYASNGSSPGPRFKFARTVQSFSNEVIFNFKAIKGNSSAWGFSSAETTLDRILFRAAAFGFDTLNQVAFMSDTTSNGFQVEGLYPFLRFQNSVFNEVSITAKINANSHLELNRFANMVLNTENTNTYELEQVEMNGFHFIISNFIGAPVIALDDVRVRKSTPLPPSIQVNGEDLVDFGVSIDKTDHPFQVSLYPNPSADNCWIKADFEEPIVLEIVDIQGKHVQSERLSFSQLENVHLDLSKLINGTYFLKFISASDQSLLTTKKLIIAR